MNGVPSCANSYLLTSMARDAWSFNGYITSDCGAVDDIMNAHHYTNTTDATCKDVLEAGMDIDCGTFLPDNLLAAIEDGSVTETYLNNSLSNLFAVLFRLGYFDPPEMQLYKDIPTAAINSLEHQALALEAAEQGVVLLKNEAKALPLSQSSISSIAVVGPNANSTTTMQGNYYGVSFLLFVSAC